MFFIAALDVLSSFCLTSNIVSAHLKSRRDTADHLMLTLTTTCQEAVSWLA